MTPRAHPGRMRFALIALLAGATVALIVAAGCRSGSPTAGAAKAPPLLAPAYAGDAACAECHRNECDHQSETSHARSLRHAGVASLGPLAPPPGPIEGTDYAITRVGDHLRMARIDRPEVSAELEYAFGSGASVMTYVGETRSDRLTEMRMSYSPGEKRWYITPGQEDEANLNLGREHELGMSTRCVLCHADRLAPGLSAPAEGSLGIGCESCHGPGGAHIAAARAHSADLKMERMHTWGAARINELCGRCHRTYDDVPLVGSDAGNTARFQAYGLAISACFKKSGDRLSCITCHNAHTDNRDVKGYEAVCLACHSRTAARREFTFPIEADKRKACPVNPREKCIDCHMPSRRIMPGTQIPLSIADHLIWAYPGKR